MASGTRKDQLIERKEGGMQQADDTLSRAKDGDQTAFADLVREHQAMVFSIAHYFSRDRAAAEDLAQEVFIHLYQNLAAIETPAHLKYWLRRVTGHRCIDHARKHKVKTVSVDEAPEPVAPPCFRDSLMTEALRRIVATLPEKPRLVVTLRYQEDLDPTEIAEALDMPLNTVKSHLRRSLAILREKVTRSLGEIKV
jgi:RNA polymerase sigma-70 factor (ECF subfamily)